MRPRVAIGGAARAVAGGGPVAALRAPSFGAAMMERPAGAGLIQAMAVGLMLAAMVAMFTVSSAMLTHWNVHYLTAGGGFYEKLHPASYLAFAAFILLALRNGDPVGEIDRMLSGAKLILLYLLCWTLLLIQTLVLERPFTVIIDTFLLPVVLCLAIWALTARQRRPLVLALHAAILLNVGLGYYEYVSGQRLVPLTVGDVPVIGEWRSAALLGHPLTASGVVGAYVIALVLRPALCPPASVRLPLIAACLGSLMVFGGRTALVTVLFVIGGTLAIHGLRLLRGGRTSLPAAIGAICLVFVAGAAIVAALDLGIFDKMLLRFSSDKGSALARLATFELLSRFDWHELVLGPNPARVNALQAQLGLAYGVENFWVSCIVQFGIIHTVLLTAGLIGLFVEILRRASPAAWAIVLLILMIAASSVSFSSKNIQLAQFVVLIALLLPRERPRPAGRGHPSPRSPAFRPL
jgi:hypothetical protein